VLHITNGDVAVGALQVAGFRQPILPWRDVLHEGPVRAGLTLKDLSRERARFIAQAGWSELAAVESDFRQRDDLLSTAPAHDEVVLWFEHDLYDQLQLIQLLDWFNVHRHPRLSLVCEAEYVGMMSAPRMTDLFAARKAVTRRQLEEGSGAWAAFRSGDPASLQRCPTSSLRFLGGALRRHLEEFPWTTDGRSRTERQIVEGGQDREEPAFLGDTVLAWHRGRLARNAWLPRWLGGVLVDEKCRWRWDPAAAMLVELP
jgi:hypothetical protein